MPRCVCLNTAAVGVVLLLLVGCATVDDGLGDAVVGMFELHLQQAFNCAGRSMELLGTYKTAIETEDMELFASCFSSDFRSSIHANLDSLKGEAARFFADHENIEVDLSDIDIQIIIPQIDLSVVHGEVREIDADKPFDLDEHMAKGRGTTSNVEDPIKYKMSVKSEDVDKGTTTLSFTCEIRASKVGTEELPAEAYFKKEHKSFSLRAQEDHVEIESEEVKKEK